MNPITSIIYTDEILPKFSLNKHLKAQDCNAIKAAFGRFTARFHDPYVQENIRNSKEEHYQGEFLIDLFVNVLGYTKNPAPNFNITTEHKNVKDSKKADGAILINSVVKAVIELKGTETTDLNRIEAQAFGYKNNQPECVYMITSNFEKLRFYIDNAIENIEFNLFTLTEKEFELLWLCRQRINWGQCFVWNPNDIFNAYSYFDFDYFEKPGSDAVRLQYYSNSTSTFDFVLKDDSANRITSALLYRFNRWNYYIQFMGGILNDNDLVLGTGWSGNISSASFTGEVSYFHPKKNFADTTGLLIFSVGSQYSFKNSFTLQTEFLYNPEKNSEIKKNR